jgi:hypothetical protein
VAICPFGRLREIIFWLWLGKTAFTSRADSGIERAVEPSLRADFQFRQASRGPRKMGPCVKQAGRSSAAPDLRSADLVHHPHPIGIGKLGISRCIGRQKSVRRTVGTERPPLETIARPSVRKLMYCESHVAFSRYKLGPTKTSSATTGQHEFRRPNSIIEQACPGTRAGWFLELHQ